MYVAISLILSDVSLLNFKVDKHSQVVRQERNPYISQSLVESL